MTAQGFQASSSTPRPIMRSSSEDCPASLTPALSRPVPTAATRSRGSCRCRLSWKASGGDDDASKRLIPGPADGVDFVLRRSRQITGRVLDAETGHPVTWFGFGVADRREPFRSARMTEVGPGASVRRVRSHRPSRWPPTLRDRPGLLQHDGDGTLAGCRGESPDGGQTLARLEGPGSDRRRRQRSRRRSAGRGRGRRGADRVVARRVHRRTARRGLLARADEDDPILCAGGVSNADGTYELSTFLRDRSS